MIWELRLCAKKHFKRMMRAKLHITARGWKLRLHTKRYIAVM